MLQPSGRSFPTIERVRIDGSIALFAWGLLLVGAACARSEPDALHDNPDEAAARGDASLVTKASASRTPRPPPVAVPAKPPPPPVPQAPVPIVDCTLTDPSDPFPCCKEAGFRHLEVMTAGPRTTSECTRIAKLPKYGSCPTFMARAHHSLVQSCFEREMNRVLDERLVPLKVTNLAQFREEMALQAHYNRAVEATTSAIMTGEPSTGDFRESFRAACALFELRARRGAAANKGELELATAPAKAAAAASFKDFAVAICALPHLWKGAATPSDCEARVRGDIAEALRRGPGF